MSFAVALSSTPSAATADNHQDHDDDDDYEVPEGLHALQAQIELMARDTEAVLSSLELQPQGGGRGTGGPGGPGGRNRPSLEEEDSGCC